MPAHKTENIETNKPQGGHGKPLVAEPSGAAVLDLRERPSPKTADIGRQHRFIDDVRRDPMTSDDRMIGALVRFTDVVGAVIGLVALSPLMAAVALSIRLTSPGPILFRHERVGMAGRPFHCLKFRTMNGDALAQLDQLLTDPQLQAQWRESRKLSEDPRVTAVGRVLRKWDLDELPQLWNVLVGEMSLVGPRPVPEDEAELYEDALKAVLSIRPGMTGLWQVSGRNELPYHQRITLDLAYVGSRRLPLNFRILLRTTMLLGRDVGRAN